MTRAAPSTAAIQPAAAYEALRAAILSGCASSQHGLAILVHRGLAAWIGELKLEASLATPSPSEHGLAARPAAPASAPGELTQVLAGIIVALTTGDTHAFARSQGYRRSSAS
jgi:hypothetical protein